MFRFLILCSFICHLRFDDSSNTFMQVTQQIYVAEEWVKNSQKEVNVEVQSHLIAEKAVRALRLEKDNLNEKVKEAIKVWDNTEAGLKTTTR